MPGRGSPPSGGLIGMDYSLRNKEALALQPVNGY